jgi:hypothetical protein
MRRPIEMKRLLPVLLGLFALVVAAPAAADPPTAIPSEDVFLDVNPCTGDIVTVTLAVTDFVHLHDGRLVVRSERTWTTSDGFAGHGTGSLVDNGQVIRAAGTDILRNASVGYVLRARSVFVLDISTGTVRVERFELTCLGPAA